MQESQISQKSQSSDLYKEARDAKASRNYEEAQIIYTALKKSYPEDWEAHFYSAQCSAMSGEGFKPIATKFIAELLTNTILLLFVDEKRRQNLLQEADDRIVPNLDKDVEDATLTVYTRVTTELNTSIHNRTVSEHLNEYLQGIFSIAFVPSTLGDWIEIYYGEKFIEYAIKSWKMTVDLIIKSMNEYSSYLNDEYFNNQKEIADKTIAKIRKYAADYQPPQIEPKKVAKSEGCYIATAVYGTYDSPELWTLRRFRDEKLRASALGSMFVRLYYRLSPTLVRHLGKYKFPKKCLRPLLDKFVRKLNKAGISSTEYMDN